MGATSDDAELRRFCEEAGSELSRALTVFTGSRQLGEEFAQEALVRCVERWDSVRKLESPLAWAIKVGMNLARSRWRRLATERRILISQKRDEELGAEHSTDVFELRQSIARLPDRQKTALVCRHLLQFDVRTTASVMNCAEGTVKALTHQAIRSLREELEEIYHYAD